MKKKTEQMCEIVGIRGISNGNLDLTCNQINKWFQREFLVLLFIGFSKKRTNSRNQTVKLPVL